MIQPEKIALVVALTALVFSIAATARSCHKLKTLPSYIEAKRKRFLEETPLSFSSPQPPSQWKNREHKLFASRILAYVPSDGSIRVLSPSEKGEDDIPYGWKRDYGFALDDPNVAAADPDKDGFSNLEEYRADTNPLLTAACPPPVQKLRLDRYQAVPFPVVFKGCMRGNQGETLFQLNITGARNHFLVVKKGQKLDLKKGALAEEGWEVGEFRRNVRMKFNPSIKLEQEVDESELDLFCSSSKKATLIKNQILDSDESCASFIALIPEEPSIRDIRCGQTFSFRGEEYQLLSASQQQAFVKCLSSDKKIAIPAASVP
ncbi:MAG: Amuc_1099 family pilus-like system protein [bacterium]